MLLVVVPALRMMFLGRERGPEASNEGSGDLLPSHRSKPSSGWRAHRVQQIAGDVAGVMIGEAASGLPLKTQDILASFCKWRNQKERSFNRTTREVRSALQFLWKARARAFCTGGKCGAHPTQIRKVFGFEGAPSCAGNLRNPGRAPPPTGVPVARSPGHLLTAFQRLPSASRS